MSLVLKDMLVANITPFTEKLEIDEDGLRSLIRYLMTVDGLGGIVCNAHAGEGATMTREERIRCYKNHQGRDKGPGAACVGCQFCLHKRGHRDRPRRQGEWL